MVRWQREHASARKGHREANEPNDRTANTHTRPLVAERENTSTVARSSTATELKPPGQLASTSSHWQRFPLNGRKSRRAARVLRAREPRAVLSGIARRRRCRVWAVFGLSEYYRHYSTPTCAGVCVCVVKCALGVCAHVRASRDSYQ